MRENRPYGLEGGESGSTGLPYPYRLAADGYDLEADGYENQVHGTRISRLGYLK